MSIYWADFHHFFTKWEVFAGVVSIRTSLRFLKGGCHGRRIFDELHGEMTLFNTLAFLNGFDYHNSDSKIFSGNTFSTHCANLIKISPVTPEITRAKTTPLWTRWQNRNFISNLSKYGMDRHHNFSMVDIYMRIIKLK